MTLRPTARNTVCEYPLLPLVLWRKVRREVVLMHYLFGTDWQVAIALTECDSDHRNICTFLGHMYTIMNSHPSICTNEAEASSFLTMLDADVTGCE